MYVFYNKVSLINYIFCRFPDSEKYPHFFKKWISNMNLEIKYQNIKIFQIIFSSFKKKEFTGCLKKNGIPKYLEKYKFYRKMFQTKVMQTKRFKKIYLLILSV